MLDDRILASGRISSARVRFLLDCLERLDRDLRGRGLRLVVRRGDPREIVPEICRAASAARITFSRDYGPYARARDAEVSRAVGRDGVAVRSFKDRVTFESCELRTQQDTAYRVYTPFRRAWWERLADDPQEPLRRLSVPGPVCGIDAGRIPSAEDLGVGDDETEIPTGGEDAARRRLKTFLENGVADYATRRDLPAEDGTSRLSAYLRLGVVSVRTCVDEAQLAAASDRRLRGGVRSWIDELVWRDFYHAILDEHPHVLERAFRPEFDAVAWDDDDDGFAAWCEGRTGFPFVDAGMRQLRATGWMHNRVRMVVASFLAKDLLVDWRRGQRFFMERLVDGDPASNNGGWQWSASTGTDAQPWFRIFNPVTQGERFDPDGEYVRRWVPELEGIPGRRVHQPWRSPLEAPRYPPPILDHGERRREALARFEAARRA